MLNTQQQIWTDAIYSQQVWRWLRFLEVCSCDLLQFKSQEMGSTATNTDVKQTQIKFHGPTWKNHWVKKALFNSFNGCLNPALIMTYKWKLHQSTSKWITVNEKFGSTLFVANKFDDDK
jgi:hypothetical protein